MEKRLRSVIFDKELKAIERLLLAAKEFFPRLTLDELIKDLGFSKRTSYRYRENISNYWERKKHPLMKFDLNTGEKYYLHKKEYQRLLNYYEQFIINPKPTDCMSKEEAMEKARHVLQLAESGEELDVFYERRMEQRRSEEELFFLDYKSHHPQEITSSILLPKINTDSFISVDLSKKLQQLKSWFHNFKMQSIVYSQNTADNLYYRALDKNNLTNEIIKKIKELQELSLPFSEFSEPAFRAIFAKLSRGCAKLAQKNDQKPGANWEQTGSKLGAGLSGIQKQLFLYIVEKIKEDNVSEPLNRTNLAKALDTTPDIIKNAINRLEEKKEIERVEHKAGRGGWTTYRIYQDKKATKKSSVSTKLNKQETSLVNNPKLIFDFCLFYSLFPNKKDPNQTATTFFKLHQSSTYPGIESILSALILQINEREYHAIKTKLWMPCWKYPSTWLNKWSWEDGLYHSIDTIHIAVKKLEKSSSAMETYNLFKSLS